MKKHTLFVVDDEQDILDNYVDLLGDSFNVVPFSKPEDFVQYFADPQRPLPDLVVTDLKMPRLSGLEMIRRVLNQNIQFPFILLTGHLDKKSAVEAIDLGAFRLLEKPTEYEVLIATIDQLLIEHEVQSVRVEIRDITSQLRELYSGLRMILQQYIPSEVHDRLIVEAPGETVTQKMSFDQLLGRLEARLEQLLESEKILDHMRTNRRKD